MKYAFVFLVLLIGCATTNRTQTCTFKSTAGSDGVEPTDVQCVMENFVLPKARSCYEDLLTATEVEFRVVQKFEISRMGRAEKISYDPDIETSSFGVCMTTALKEAKLPTHASEKPVTITYPWVFKRKH